MIFKLATKELYSDEGLLIKKLHCPRLIKWQSMSKVDGSQNKICSSCRKSITDTEAMSDEQVINLIGRDSEACLKVGLGQENIKVINIYD